MAVNLTTSSITDFLASIGQASDYNTRRALAAQYGISNYSGTAAQNTQLLNIVRNNYVRQNQQQQPQQPQPQQPTTPTQTYTSSPTVVPQPTNASSQSYQADPVVNMGDINAMQIQLRSQIQQGQISPTDAWSMLDSFIRRQISIRPNELNFKEQELYDRIAPLRRTALYNNLGTVKTTDGNIGTVNPQTGAIIRTSTQQNNSTTSLGGGTSATSGARLYDAYTGQPITGPYNVDNKTGVVTAVGTIIPPGGTPVYNSTTGQLMNQNGFPVTVNGQTYYAATQADADKITSGIAPALQGLINQGLQIDPNVNIDDSTIALILEKAKTLVHPQFAQQVAGVVDDLKRLSGLYADEYGNQVAGQEDAFVQNLADSRDASANAGTIFSGGRMQKEDRMAKATDRTLASLSSSFGTKIGDLAREGEKALGTQGYLSSGYTLPNLSTYRSNTQNEGGFNLNGGIDTKFTPGVYNMGLIPQAETAAALALRNANVNEASRRKTQGLSYTDLYQ